MKCFLPDLLHLSGGLPPTAPSANHRIETDDYFRLSEEFSNIPNDGHRFFLFCYVFLILQFFLFSRDDVLTWLNDSLLPRLLDDSVLLRDTGSVLLGTLRLRQIRDSQGEPVFTCDETQWQLHGFNSINWGLTLLSLSSLLSLSFYIYICVCVCFYYCCLSFMYVYF